MTYREVFVMNLMSKHITNHDWGFLIWSNDYHRGKLICLHQTPLFSFLMQMKCYLAQTTINQALFDPFWSENISFLIGKVGLPSRGNFRRGIRLVFLPFTATKYIGFGNFETLNDTFTE